MIKCTAAQVELIIVCLQNHFTVPQLRYTVKLRWSACATLRQAMTKHILCCSSLQNKYWMVVCKKKYQSLVMPNSESWEGNFCPYLTAMIDTYCLTWSHISKDRFLFMTWLLGVLENIVVLGWFPSSTLLIWMENMHAEQRYNQKIKYN